MKLTPVVNFINILRAAFALIFLHQEIIQSQTKGKLRKKLSYKKGKSKMLMKLRPGLDFINVLRTAFALVDPESVKNTVKSSVSFYAFGIYERKS